MYYIKFPLIGLLIAFIVGILIENYLNLPLNWLFLGLLLGIISTLIYYIYSKKRKTNPFSFVVTTVISFFILGALHKNIQTDLNSKNHFSNFIQDENNLIIGSVHEKLKPTPYYDKYIIDVSQINRHVSIGKTLLYVPKKEYKKLVVGKEIKVFSKIKFIESVVNPYQFNYTNYLNNQNIYHDIHILKEDKIITNSKYNWRYYIHYIKEKLITSFTYLHLKEDNYNLLIALLFGERTTLSKEITNSYTNTGVIHILAISGLHIALFYSIILWFTKPLKKLKKGDLFIFVISISILWLYALLTGMSASVVRAVVMFTVIAYGNLLNKQVNIYNSLATSALILLLWNPNYLFDIGFQLSYCAVIAIVSFQPIVHKYSYSKKWYVIKIKETLLITLVAQLGVLPLTLYYFGQFPILFLASNVIVIPVSSIILILGLALVPFNFIAPSLGKYIGNVVEFLIVKMNNFTFWIGHFENLIIKNIAFHEVLVLLLFGIICSILYYLSYPKRKNLSLVLSTIILFQIAYLIIFLSKKEETEFIIFNSYKSSLIAIKNNHTATFYSNKFDKNEELIFNYCRSNFITKEKNKPLENILYFNKKILCIDSNSIYKTKIHPEVILLIQSPKLNLDRLIQTHHPQQIIADGSNYKSYIQRWKETCEKQKIPFHATTEKGLFQIK